MVAIVTGIPFVCILDLKLLLLELRRSMHLIRHPQILRRMGAFSIREGWNKNWVCLKKDLQFMTLLATTFDRFEGIGSPLESGDWRK
jgi:hypothetical protein